MQMEITGSFSGVRPPGFLGANSGLNRAIPPKLPQAAGDSVRFGAFWNRQETGKLKLLLDAIERDDEAMVRRHIADDVKLNRFSNGICPLFQAIDLNRENLVDILLENGADPNLRGFKNRNVLMDVLNEPKHADNSADKLARQRCLEKIIPKTDLDHVDRDGDTASTMAARNGYDEALLQMARLGADVTLTQRKDKMTALMYLAWRGKPEVPEVVRGLLEAVPFERRAEYISAKNRYGRTAEAIALSTPRPGNEHLDFIKALRDALRPPAPEPDDLAGDAGPDSED